MELTERSLLHLPQTVDWQREEVHLILDPESPHWVAVDSRGAQILEWLRQGLTFGQILRRYGENFSAEAAKAWLHTHDFLQALLRVGFASPEPRQTSRYLGRAAYARPTGLKEFWFHTNNICNLSCSHCLVSSAPWVQDWGIPTERFLKLVDEAVSLGVDRFYFTGGEPFMRPDIFQLIRTVTETKGCELILLTNATLFKGERAQALKTLNRDKVRFQVSLDGASSATNDPIRGKGSFEKAVEGLGLLVKLGFQTSITTAVAARNLKDLVEITRLAHRLGVPTQHLMWLHKRGRMVGEELAEAVATNGHPSNGEAVPLTFPETEQLIEAVRAVKREADRLGLTVDNIESIKQRVNARPGVKYDLGNACWDSLCLYSDGTVYPSAAMANFKPLALGSVKDQPLRDIWERSPIAEAFRQASVARKTHLNSDPFRYLTGGGDLEHTFWFNAPGGQRSLVALPLATAGGVTRQEGLVVPPPPAAASGAASASGSRLDGDSTLKQIAPDRILEILSGPDPYYPLYQAMIQDAIWEMVFAKRDAVNRKSGYDVPRIFHAMGEGAIHCATDDLALTGEIDVRTLHSNCVLAFDVDKPRRLVQEFYGKAAETPQAELCCPTKFDDSSIAHIPKEVIDRFYGCGSPVTLADLKVGETMLDLGSGAGIDCFIASKIVGKEGRVIGIDMTGEMLKVANENRPRVAKNLGFSNVEFNRGFLEEVPVASKSADLVTSNCVINLSPDKPKVFAEIWRILKDHGRTVISDIVSDRPVPAHLKVNPQLWGECIVGALTQEEFLAQLEEAGFYGLTVLKKVYWKTIEGYDFHSVTVRGYKFEKQTGCRFIGQRAVYLGPMKSVVDEEGHLFPRDLAVEVCTDTAAKLSQLPYQGSFVVLELGEGRKAQVFEADSAAACGPDCC